MPFSPSYALEVLDRSLDAKAAKETVAGSHHDALYDAYATQRVFLECINRLDKVHARFPQIQNYLSRSLAPLAQIIHRDSQEEKLSSSLPILNKTYLSDKKLISDEHIEKDSLANTEKLFVGHRSLKELCKMLPKENVIYAFSQRNKVQIAKNVLHELGLTHIDTGAQRAFNSKLLSLFFQKQSFNERETYFAIKYFFHAYREDGTIDLNNPYDRKIYHALKEITTKNAIKPVELLTHEMLYDKIRNHELMPYTTIFFFDQDRWYDTHMKRAQRAFDLHYILQITDSLIYRDQLISPDQSSLRETVHTKLVIFVGIWQTEVAALLKDVSNSTVEIDNIADNTYFYKINLLIPQIDELLTQIATKASDDDLSLVQEKRATFKEILDAPCTIMTRLQ